MVFHDFIANGRSHSAPFELASPVQSFERFEQALKVLLIETDTLIGNAYFPMVILRSKFGTDLDHRGFTLLMKLEGISNQILKQLPHLHRVGFDDRKRFNRNAGFLLIDSYFQIRQDLRDNFCQVGGFKMRGFGRNFGIFKKVVD